MIAFSLVMAVFVLYQMWEFIPVVVSLANPNLYVSSEYITAPLSNMVDIRQNVTYEDPQDFGQRFYNFWLRTFVTQKITQRPISTKNTGMAMMIGFMRPRSRVRSPGPLWTF